MVATTGDVGAAGTQDGPLKTIGKAVTLAGPGDTAREGNDAVDIGAYEF